MFAGCGGSDDEAAAVPDGFEQFDGRTFTFAYPSDWSPLEAGTVQGRAGAGGHRRARAAGRRVERPEPERQPRPGHERLPHRQQTRRGNWKIVRKEKVEIEGAKEAVMTEAVYDEVTGGTTTPVRTIDVHALTEDGQLYDFFVRAPEADFDQQRLREAVDTFRVK